MKAGTKLDGRESLPNPLPLLRTLETKDQKEILVIHSLPQHKCIQVLLHTRCYAFNLTFSLHFLLNLSLSLPFKEGLCVVTGTALV